MTYSGYAVHSTIYTLEGLRIIATDNSVIPIGSVVRVQLTDGTTFKAKALDRGSAINGAELDLLVGTRAEALDFGRQKAEVTVLDEE